MFDILLQYGFRTQLPAWPRKLGLQCLLAPLPSPPLCGIWHCYQRGIMDRLWLFRCISLCALSSFLYLRKALKQPTVDEGFYFFARNSNLPHTMFQYLRSSRLLFSISGLNFISNFLVAATFNNFSVSPIYSFTAFD